MERIKMFKAIYRQLSREEGQSLVITALAMIALLGMTALIIDGGYAYAQHRRMQNAADLATLAGARALGLGLSEWEIEQEISYYAQANGADTFSYYFIDANGQPVGSLSAARGVAVTTQHTFDTFLAAIIGKDRITVAADSKATLYGIGETNNLLPIAVHEDNFEYEMVYELWDNNHEAPGAFGWVDWDGGGGGLHELADNIAHPENSGTWQVGDQVPAEPGVKAGMPVRRALDQWIGQPVTVILYDEVTGQGSNARYHISGFAEFVLTEYNFRGSNKYIRGYFVRYVTSGKPGGSEFGLQGIRFIE
ncbi:MAG TPA: hypothetical protein G4O02_08425 [Caldilineae bacterium]|jgi:Flp pilus assembly protein TadG|nr:hypothetical protein [Caldilineae bacterium]